jgi:glycine/D-amino acid oxidase-like deaminating enzyme/nitrite reductase/ring-hydroxylating ferredoxin subunit
MGLRKESLWVDTTPKTNLPILTTGIKVDVAIIGAGIAGLTSAYFLNKAGLKIAVIDKDRIIKGTTGYTTAKVTSAHGDIYHKLISGFGKDKSRIYAESNQKAIEKIAEIIKKENITCDFHPTRAYTYVSDKKNISDLEKEFESSRLLGLLVSLVTKLELPFRVEAAIQFENQAKFHPRKYLLALAEKIAQNGGKIFEQTQVEEIKDGNPLLIKTNQGEIKAGSVIISTRTPFIKDDLYQSFLLPHQSYVIAARVKKPPFQGVFYSEEDGSYSLRTHESKQGNFLIIGGPEHKAGKGKSPEEYYQELEDFIKAHFDIERIVYHWAAEDNYSRDWVPLIGQYRPNSNKIFIAAGFGTWGMTNGTVSGILLSDLILGKRNSWINLYNPLRIYKHKKEEDTTAKKTKEEQVSEIPAGEGDVFKIGLFKKIAVYKDPDGNPTVLSPICRHLGCTVGWNNKDKTWDCPCHGSRYDKFGKVIHGPAKKDLIKETSD